MKAAVFKEKGVLKIEDVPEPEVGPSDVLLRINHCAICGSDLHRYLYGMLEPGSIMGHEYSGTIVEKGDEVQGFQIGDRVTRSGGRINPGKEVFPLPARYSAKLKGFQSVSTNGAYAEYMAVDADRLMKIPDSVTNLEASMTEPLTVAIHAVRLSKIRLGDRVLVIGAGPIGLLTQQCAALSGAIRVFVSETSSARRTLASELGASAVYDPRNIDLVEELVGQTEIGVDIAFECAGANPTLQVALEAVRIAGRVIVVSLAWEPVQCLPVDWVGREIEMKASYGALPGDWPIALELIESGNVILKPMISEIIPLEDIQSAFQQLLKPDVKWVQVVVAFE
jgi:(R,R)-butanediol dehydrogenase/meso-butanediol dehydrogenase/diacetyl reductase